MLGSDMGRMRRSDPGWAFCRAKNLVQQEKLQKKCRWDFHLIENVGSDLAPACDFVGAPRTFSLCICKILHPNGTTSIAEIMFFQSKNKIFSNVHRCFVSASILVLIISVKTNCPVTMVLQNMKKGEQSKGFETYGAQEWLANFCLCLEHVVMFFC